MNYSRKIQTGGLENILSWKKTRDFLRLSLYPWNFWTKRGFTLGNFVKLCYTSWKFQGQKPRLVEIKHDFFLITPGNSTSFSTDLWNLRMTFLHYTWKFCITVKLISYGFLCLQHGWYMQNNSVAALFNMLATNSSCGNIRCFDQNYQSGKITLQVSVLIIKYLVAVSFG